jgi:hypothetical protein
LAAAIALGPASVSASGSLMRGRGSLLSMALAAEMGRERGVSKGVGGRRVVFESICNNQ